MYCTTLYLEKRILYRCLFIILSIGLLLQPIAPFRSQEMWDETLLPQARCRRRVRRMRCRRWIRRRRLCRRRHHHGMICLALLRRRGKVLLYCLGLVAALLMWSEWPQRWPLAWMLLSLPLTDALLSLLPLLWPRVLKVRVYLRMVQGARDLYRLTVAALFCAGLFIPLTNNTVELVNRRFDQHYQNMCGFDGIETARKYLHLFELTYRFTPFAKDNRTVKGRKLDIRGKCPLELAGYDISHMPIARVVRGQLLGWPPETLRGLVP